MCKYVQYPSVQHLKKTFFYSSRWHFYFSLLSLHHFSTLHTNQNTFIHTLLCLALSSASPLPSRLSVAVCLCFCEHVLLVVRAITCCLTVYKMLVFVCRFQACYMYKHAVLKRVKAASPPTLDPRKYAYRANGSANDTISSGLHTGLQLRL